MKCRDAQTVTDIVNPGQKTLDSCKDCEPWTKKCKQLRESRTLGRKNANNYKGREP